MLSASTMRERSRGKLWWSWARVVNEHLIARRLLDRLVEFVVRATPELGAFDVRVVRVAGFAGGHGARETVPEELLDLVQPVELVHEHTPVGHGLPHGHEGTRGDAQIGYS